MIIILDVVELNKIYNEDCRQTMKRIPVGTCNIVLTSPFYNTNKKQGKKRTLLTSNQKKDGYSYLRYDMPIDTMTNNEYTYFTKELFNEFDRILDVKGCVLYNLSYGNENTTQMIETVNAIIQETNFTLADIIVWKKQNAMPNNCSSNRLTRICEFVYVFCRKDEIKTFYCNKEVKSVRKSGQKSYSNIYNFIEAKNNDGTCPYNKATYSTEFCEKLLNIYAPKQGIVYDPFIGSGTTAVACLNMDLSYIGSEISYNQCEFAKKRLQQGK